MQSDSLTAAIYVRLSQDRDGETSTARQEADCRRMIEAKGWKVGEVYRDVDLSAWSGVERPAYERALADAADGRFGVLMVWKIDRLARSLREFMRAVDTLDAAKVVLTSYSDPVDTSSPMGRAMLQVVGVFAELESSTISYRVKSALALRAQNGGASVGGRRTFGYNRDGSVNGTEAELLREAARRFLAGESLSSIVKGWNTAGIRTGSDNEWGPSVLGRLLARERIAGLRRHGETIYPGNWEPIIDMDTHLALLEALEDSRRLSVRRGVSRNLLTGLARCGLCGSGLGTRPRKQGGITYVCVNAPGRRGCGKVRIVGTASEDLVRDALFVALAEGAAVPAVEDRNPADVEAGLLADRAALEQLARDHYVDRLIDRAEFMAARKPLQERVAQAESDIARSRRRSGLSVPADIQGSWNAADVEGRRHFLESLIDHVVVHPATVGTNRFDRRRLEVVWKGDRLTQQPLADAGTCGRAQPPV